MFLNSPLCGFSDSDSFSKLIPPLSCMSGYIRDIVSLPISPDLRAKLKSAGFGSTADLEGFDPESLSKGQIGER